MNEIEKIAEVLFNKGFSEDKNKCLEAATELKKDAETYFVSKVLSEEKVEQYIKEYKSFRKSIFGMSRPTKYTGERKTSYKKIRIWAKKDIARVYADKYIDGYLLNNAYVEFRIPKEKLFDI